VQGKDLKKYHVIRDREGERFVPEEDFPIVIGGELSADIRIPGLGERGALARIGLSEGQPYVRAVAADVPLRHNGREFHESIRLSPDDTLQIGTSEIVLRIEDGSFVFQVSAADRPSKAFSSAPIPDFQSAIDIEPLPFHAERRRPASRHRLRWLLGAILFALLGLSSVAAWFVFTARQVVVRVEPAPDEIAVLGGLIAPRLGSYYLLRPGEYTIRAAKDCYHSLEQRIEVTREKSQTVLLSLERLPGRLTLAAHQAKQPSVAVDGARVTIDGREVGMTPLQNVEVKAGRRRVDVRAPKYQTLSTRLTVDGCGATQAFDFALAPGWSDTTITSVPEGANVRVDGKLVGQTPVHLEFRPGAYDLEIRADRYKTWRSRLVVKANQPRELAPVRLLPADGALAVRTNPPGANVTIGGNYTGNTPLEVALPPGTNHVVRISKAGYEDLVREVTVTPEDSKELALDLVPRKGIVRLSVTPTDAELWVNGKSYGSSPQELQLVAVEQKLELRKEGFQPFQTKVTPRPGFPQEVKISLQRLTPVKGAASPSTVKAANGYVLQLIRPGTFTMGSSRREQGRRSNETLRNVNLQRPFYMGTTEVTNREFRQFLGGHNSGSVQRHSLNRDELPVARVTWEQAAQFCNWLSDKESLPPVYVNRSGKWVAAEPLGMGYRLPTEAEWEYCARFQKGQAALKYPWGKKFPPTPKSGNFADLSAKDLLANYLETYNDGYAGTAPPATFKANGLGLYDMGGNVAEWCHDYYSIYSYKANKEYVDPLGPSQGSHRVVRGSSWKHSGISELRLSYRDYSTAGRPDLGFRVCRYLNAAGEEN
jgi:formylglycine-generating enzyme required for sulfatase activity